VDEDAGLDAGAIEVLLAVDPAALSPAVKPIRYPPGAPPPF
jgi:hypothetical protein